MTDTSTSVDRFEERLSALETVRAEVSRRERVTLIGLMPLAIAMALIIPYMQIVITLQEADYYYILSRPDWPVYFRLLGAALFAAPISLVIIYVAFKQFEDMLPTLPKLLIVGGIFGMLMPFITGLLTPLNLFVLGITGVSNVTGQGSVQQMLGDWVFSTPMFTFFFWADWLGPGILFGLVAGVLFWIVTRFAGPIEQPERARNFYIGSSIAGLTILFLVTVWPFALFEFMFETFL